MADTPSFGYYQDESGMWIGIDEPTYNGMFADPTNPYPLMTSTERAERAGDSANRVMSEGPGPDAEAARQGGVSEQRIDDSALVNYEGGPGLSMGVGGLATTPGAGAYDADDDGSSSSDDDDDDWYSSRRRGYGGYSSGGGGYDNQSNPYGYDDAMMAGGLNARSMNMNLRNAMGAPVPMMPGQNDDEDEEEDYREPAFVPGGAGVNPYGVPSSSTPPSNEGRLPPWEGAYQVRQAMAGAGGGGGARPAPAAQAMGPYAAGRRPTPRIQPPMRGRPTSVQAQRERPPVRRRR